MNFTKKTLKNGLRVITIPMPSFESSTVMVGVGAGSRYETRQNNGISHFLEHMAFKGTKKRPTAMHISSLIDGIGGEFNAGTDKEITTYFVESAAGDYILCLDVISDMIKYSTFVKEEIEKERGVILGEINLYEDTPAKKIGDIYESLLYGDTPMGWDIAGEKKIIKKISKEDFLDYLRNLYSPKNMVVVVAGGINPKKVNEQVEKYFGEMKSFDTLRYRKVVEKQNKPKVLLKSKKTEQAHIALGVRTVSLTHPDHYALEILASILGGGMSSRLFHEVREKRGLGYYVRTSHIQYQDVGTLVSVAGIDPKRLKEGISVMVEEYEKIKTSSRPTEAELMKVKGYIKGHFVRGLEKSKNVASFFVNQEILERRIETPEEFIKKIEKITLDDVNSVAKKYLVEKNLNLAVIGNFADGQPFEKLLRLK